VHAVGAGARVDESRGPRFIDHGNSTPSTTEPELMFSATGPTEPTFHVPDLDAWMQRDPLGSESQVERPDRRARHIPHLQEALRRPHPTISFETHQPGLDLWTPPIDGPIVSALGRGPYTWTWTLPAG
jgi:hypothetical protein